MKSTLSLSLNLALCAGFLLAATTGRAQSVLYHVDVDTSALVGNVSGPFSLDFQLNDGSGLGDANNLATINNFSFGSGGASGGATLLGGATGNLSSVVTLTDITPFNEFYQSFNAGNTLSFDVALTLNSDAGPTPDAFSFAILDNSLYNIPTTGVGDSLLLVNLGAAPTVVMGSGISPAVTVNVTVAPEPGALACFALGLVALGLWRRTGLKFRG